MINCLHILKKYYIDFLTIFIISIFLPIYTLAQVASTYSFTQASSTYTSISGGTVLGDINIDDPIFLNDVVGSLSNQTGAGFPIGFTFTYDGFTYTQFGVCTNGYIKLGNNPSFTMLCNGFYVNMPTTGDNLIIGGFVNDLQGQTGSILQYLTSGTAPNRVLTVQWSGFRGFNATGDDLNFQIQLFESTGVIQVNFGACTYGGFHDPSQATSMMGIYGSSNADYALGSSGTDWTAISLGAANDASIPFNAGSVPVNGTAFGFFPTVPLPVELLTFKALCKNADIKIEWSTATEKDNDYFTIEQSDDGQIWKEIGRVKGSGTTSNTHFYTFIHRSTNYDITYFRLKQTDFDKTFKYFQIISLKRCDINSINQIVIYPNPFSNQATIETNSPLTNATLLILNSYGAVVKEINNVTGSSVVLQRENLPSGLYLIELIDEDIVHKGKLIISDN